MAKLIRIVYLGVVALSCGYLLLPTIVVTLASFSPSAALRFPPTGFSLRWYENFFAREEFLDAFGLSLSLAIVAATLATGLALLAAVALRESRPSLRQAVQGTALLPIILPTVIYGPALLILAAQLWLTRSAAGTIAVIGLAHLVLALPFAIQVVFTNYDGLEASLEEGARIAGATRSRILTRIIVPLMAPGLIASFLFAFLISFDEPIVSLFLARHDVTTLPPRILTYLRFRSDPTVAAVSTIMSLLAIAAIIVIDRLVGPARPYLRPDAKGGLRRGEGRLVEEAGNDHVLDHPGDVVVVVVVAQARREPHRADREHRTAVGGLVEDDVGPVSRRRCLRLPMEASRRPRGSMARTRGCARRRRRAAGRGAAFRSRGRSGRSPRSPRRFPIARNRR